MASSWCWYLRSSSSSLRASATAAPDPTQNPGQSIGGAVADLLGKIWNLPNDVIGLVFGGLGYVVGWAAFDLGASWQPNAPTISFGGNALQFGNNPLVAFGTAITFGNVESFEGSPGELMENGLPVYQHEDQHTYQGQALGPLYLPSYVVGGILSLAAGGQFFGRGNWMETGPYANPPQPWP